jgi:Rod binding domain-containing protein
MPDTVLSPLLTSETLSRGLQPDAKKDSPEQIHHAAQEFESLLLSQILKSAHGEDEGWLGTGDDQTASSAMGIAEEQLAQAISARGGLGLSGLIEQGLTKSKNATQK